MFWKSFLTYWFNIDTLMTIAFLLIQHWYITDSSLMHCWPLRFYWFNIDVLIIVAYFFIQHWCIDNLDWLIDSKLMYLMFVAYIDDSCFLIDSTLMHYWFIIDALMTIAILLIQNRCIWCSLLTYWFNFDVLMILAYLLIQHWYIGNRCYLLIQSWCIDDRCLLIKSTLIYCFSLLTYRFYIIGINDRCLNNSIDNLCFLIQYWCISNRCFPIDTKSMHWWSLLTYWFKIDALMTVANLLIYIIGINDRCLIIT